MGEVIYIFLGISLCLTSFIEFGFHNYHKKLTFSRQLYIFYVVVIVLFAGLRSDTGLDFSSYELIFHQIKAGASFFETRVEPGFWLLNFISPSFQFLLLFMATISIVPFAVIFYRECSSKFLCVFLFYCTILIYYDMGIMREGFEIALAICSLKYVKERKLLKFLFLVLLGGTFHLTAIAFLPIYFIKDKRYKFPTYSLILFAVFVLGIKYSDFLFNIIGIFSSNFALAAHKFNIYMSIMKPDNSSIIGASLYRTGLLVVFLFCFYFLSKDKKSFNSQNSWLYFNAYYLSTIEFLALSIMPYFATRFSAVLYYAFFIIYDKLTGKYFNKYLRFFFYLLAVVTSFRTLINTVFNSADNLYIPYKLATFSL